ncbi:MULTISPECIES: ATP-binding protein [unclassified Leptolyngbya]|uniref:ATP-binding protein n=1 Tax=unclassified Leptolyngbya TaxID=2650499 RepID=UPI0016850142|nr:MULTISPECIES: ATP-binding protein [unclassified Leptolyngbya]MBD1910868.1 histidine kinase [Leptolyngbya sp. FACHB-8]MBD2153737.1 histidine kinase [Leptolyngbya sp. FACHB-16]
MKSSSLQDVSLYELALSSEQPPHPLQLSPTTFKSLISLLIDLLLEKQIPATVWMKLPRGDVWQAEVERFRRSAVAPHTIYAFSSHRSEPPKQSSLAAQMGMLAAELGSDMDSCSSIELQLMSAETDALIDDQGVIAAAQPDTANSVFLPIQSEIQLRREYFVLILSEEFSVLVLAHRPRTIRSQERSVATEDIPADTSLESPLADEEERKHLLLTLCSFDSATIQKVLTGIHLAIASSVPHNQQQEELTSLLLNWSQVTAPANKVHLDPAILSHLMVRQIQRQEEMWHRTAGYRRQAESASTLQLENEELQNAIRLKDEFLKNVGQELRTPLSSMKTALTLLGSPTLKPPQRQRYMDMLTQECDRQGSLITSVLDLLQLENVDDHTATQPIRLSDVVPGIVSTYQPLAQEKGIMLAYTVPEDLPTVTCTTPWLRQIVINLLHNGIKFTPQGGQVWVKAKQQGEFVQIDVRDTGAGIAQSDIPKIFDRFYRVRHGQGDDTSGAGLGLSIVQQLLLRCGGSISVRSKSGEGSTFSVMLPVYE